MLLKFFQYIVLFFYIYSIQLIGLPFGIGTRIVLAGLGLGLLIVNIKKKISFNQYFVKFLVVLFFLSLISLITTIINITNDYQFIDYSASLILIFLAAYFTFNIFLINKNVDQEKYFQVISEGIVLIILIQSLLALMMFVFPPLGSFLNSIQLFIDLDVDKMEEALEMRIVGFGIKFFAFGIVNGFALILITSLLRNVIYTPFKQTLIWIFYFVIFVVGMMAARTTVIGFILSLLIYFNPLYKGVKVKKEFKLKVFGYILILIIIFSFIINFFFIKIDDKISGLFEFGFDLFFNYFNTGNANSESLNQMSEMYIWPTELHTYLIGDGRFRGSGTDFYYMGTDIGWVRLLYYFGVLGTFVYFLTHYFVLSKCVKKYWEYRYTLWIILIYFIILNFKGFSDIIFLIIPYLFTLSNKKNKVSNEL